MAEDKVFFDRNGEYNISGTPQDMDVSGKRAAATPKKGKTTGTKKSSTTPAKKGGTNKKTAPARGGFDLASLRSKAGMDKKASAEPVLDVAPKEESVVEATPPVVESTPAPVSEQVVEPASAAPVEEKVTSTAEVVDVSSAVEESPVVDSAPVPEPPRPEFSLNQMGDAPQRPVPVETSEQEPELKSMDLGSTQASAAQKQAASEVSSPAALDLRSVSKATPKQQTVATEETTETKVSTEPAAKAAPVSPTEEVQFVITPAVELLSTPYGGSSLEDVPESLRNWVKKAIKESPRHPAAIFSSTFYPELRIYSLFHAVRGTDMCVAIGKDIQITVVSVDVTGQRYLDISNEVSLWGTCAMVQDKPVASTSQRNYDTIAL